MLGLAAVLVGGFGLTSVLAQAPAAKRDFDKEMEAALRAAKDAAGFEWMGTLNRLCVLPPSNGPLSTADAVPGYVTDPKTAPARDTWFAEPAKVADDFYWLGGKQHSAWVLGDEQNGYFLFDSQYTYNSEELVLGGMKKLGLDVSKVKYHFTSHTHGDHVGAIAMIQKASPTSIAVFGKPDYDDILKYPLRFTGVVPDPKRVVTIEKQPLQVAYSGGTAFNFQTDKADPGIKNLQQYIASNQMFMDLAVKAKATMLISNHSEFDMAEKKAKMLAGRGPNDPNPFALGEEWTPRYFQVAINCSKYKIIQLEKAAQGAI
jgi:metallo-beta-lactamase class B